MPPPPLPALPPENKSPNPPTPQMVARWNLRLVVVVVVIDDNTNNIIKMYKYELIEY